METITISLKEYNDLKERALKYDALRDAGVNNWEGYDEAIEEVTKKLNEE